MSTDLTAESQEPQEARRRSRKAIGSLVVGLLPVVLICFLLPVSTFSIGFVIFLGVLGSAFVSGLLAVIFGHQARASIRRSGGKLLGKRTVTAGLILGYADLVAILLVVLFLVFLPAFVHGSREAANQAASVGSLRLINGALNAYASTYGRGYPPALEALGPPRPAASNGSGQPDENAAGLIDEMLAAGEKFGYRFKYVAGNAGPNKTIGAYTVRAEPIVPGVFGEMYYFTDQTGVIRQEKRKEADSHSKPVN
jgi:type II secretory pathway pseudopilin PulG